MTNPQASSSLNFRWFIKPQTVQIYFDDSIFLLSRISHEVFIASDPVVCTIIKSTDGRLNGFEVAASVESLRRHSKEEALQIVEDVYHQLINKCLITFKISSVDKLEAEVPQMQTKYQRNPDVQMREEDEHGALLFNPDTNMVSVINVTARYIWEKCDTSRALDEIVAFVKEDFEDVEDVNVRKDTEEYLDRMIAQGFMGIVKSE